MFYWFDFIELLKWSAAQRQNHNPEKTMPDIFTTDDQAALDRLNTEIERLTIQRRAFIASTIAARAPVKLGGRLFLLETATYIGTVTAHRRVYNAPDNSFSNWYYVYRTDEGDLGSTEGQFGKYGSQEEALERIQIKATLLARRIDELKKP